MEILYADNILLILKNILTINILFHAVEIEPAYRHIISNINGNNLIRFKDNIHNNNIKKNIYIYAFLLQRYQMPNTMGIHYIYWYGSFKISV